MAKKSKSTKSRLKVQQVVIHGIAHARAACQAAMEGERRSPITLELWSAKSAAGSLGPAWFGNIIDLVQGEFPELKITGVLDCGDAPGNALAALRHGIDCIHVAARPVVLAKITAIAQQTKADVRTRRPAMPDLMDHPDPVEFFRNHFS